MRAVWYAAGAPWGGKGTYARHPLSKMPRLSVPFSGAFDWLTPSLDGGLAYAEHVEREDGEIEIPPDLPPEDKLMHALFAPLPPRKPPRDAWDPLEALVAEASAHRLVMPPDMIKFLSSPDLFRHVPTCTACYLDLSQQLIRGPERGSKMIRFLVDQQCCLIWYVLVEKHGHSVIAATPRWKRRIPREATRLEDRMSPENFVRVASSFEEFIYRFWIENSIWYARHRKRALTVEQRAYADAAERSLARTRS